MKGWGKVADISKTCQDIKNWLNVDMEFEFDLLQNRPPRDAIKDAVDSLEELMGDLRIMFNRCIMGSITTLDCSDCKLQEKCEAMRVMMKGFVRKNGQRVPKEKD